MQYLKAYKEKQYLVFMFEDGRDVRYNLSNGETIGLLGKPVKDICTQLRNHNILSVIKSFEDENYSEFLKYIDRNFINRSEQIDRGWGGRRSNKRVDKIRNLGSFLSRIDKYSHFEQYFACGIRKIATDIDCKINDLPKGILKLCAQYDLELTKNLIKNYSDNPDLFNNLLGMEFMSIRKEDVLNALLEEQGYYQRELPAFKRLVTNHSYKPQALVRYIDNLVTYEALDSFNTVVSELADYVNMMSKISPKYEKYPKNFLTTHKIASRNYNRLKEQFVEMDFAKRIDNSLEYTYGKYKFIYPETTQDIKDEAVQQNNCVASYIQKVIDGDCHILFMRLKDNTDRSLITIEVRDNKVVQAKGKFNRDVSNEEQNIINKYNTRLQRIISKGDMRNVS